MRMLLVVRDRCGYEVCSEEKVFTRSERFRFGDDLPVLIICSRNSFQLLRRERNAFTPWLSTTVLHCTLIQEQHTWDPPYSHCAAQSIPSPSIPPIPHRQRPSSSQAVSISTSPDLHHPYISSSVPQKSLLSCGCRYLPRSWNRTYGR